MPDVPTRNEKLSVVAPGPRLKPIINVQIIPGEKTLKLTPLVIKESSFQGPAPSLKPFTSGRPPDI